MKLRRMFFANGSAGVPTIAVLVGVLPLLRGADPVVRTEVQNAWLVVGGPSDSRSDHFKVQFDLQLANESAKTIKAPISAKVDAQSTRIKLAGAQVKQADGKWKDLFHASWYDHGQAQYTPCDSVDRGGVATIRGISAEFSLLKEQVADFNGPATLRVSLRIFCREKDGEVYSSEVTTEAFRLEFPTFR